jgi:Mrp family chromosome partitioning ATPase
MAVSSQVVDPTTQKTLKDLGWLNRRIGSSSGEGSDDQMSFQILLRLPTLLHPELDELKECVRSIVDTQISAWVTECGLSHGQQVDNERQFRVEVHALPSPKPPVPWTIQAGRATVEDIEQRHGPGLTHVAHVVAVYSCKGGVGKSTVALNLAYQLASRGGRVGILDLDIYGPSLPTLMAGEEQGNGGKMDSTVRRSPLGSNMVYPIQHKGVKLLSLGYVSSNSGVPGSGRNNDGAAILRGPMAGRVVTQLCKGTDWGELDVLVLDLPPGTGDVQLTVCQEMDVSCAVGVTTPSKVSVADALKGVTMFNELGIPTVAMVENMAYFDCDGGNRHYPFGKADYSSINIDLNNLCQLPLSEKMSNANETGIPLCLEQSSDAEVELSEFSKLADIVSKAILLLPFQESSLEQGRLLLDNIEYDISTIKLSHDKGQLLVRLFSDEGATQKRLSAHLLRRVDPKSGSVVSEETPRAKTDPFMEQKGMVSLYKAKSTKPDPESITVTRVEEKAKVGFEVTFSDNARFIYSRKAIAIAAGGTIV